MLSGIRVLDFSSMIAGPYCTRWLADLGAEVIKIEPPEGDHMRHRPPVRDGCSSFFGHFNSGKRYVALDLKKPEAVRIAIDLARQSDVIVEAFRPRVMERLGLSPQVLRGINPRLVYCSISGFGQASSASSRPAYAPVVHAASGYYMALSDCQDDAQRPVNSVIPMADMLTAIFAAMAIQTALFARERTGSGTEIDVNLMDSVMNVMAYEFQAAQFPMSNRRPLYKPLRASDGFVLVAPVNDRNFRNLCSAVGHPEWVDDAALSTASARFENWTEYMRRIEAWTMERSAEECESVLMAAGVPCSCYRRIGDAMHDVQFEERGSFSVIEDLAGQYLTTNLPFSLSGVKPQAGRTVGQIGRDTVSVLAGLLGLDRDRIDELLRQRVAIEVAAGGASG